MAARPDIVACVGSHRGDAQRGVGPRRANSCRAARSAFLEADVARAAVGDAARASPHTCGREVVRLSAAASISTEWLICLVVPRRGQAEHDQRVGGVDSSAVCSPWSSCPVIPDGLGLRACYGFDGLGVDGWPPRSARPCAPAYPAQSAAQQAVDVPGSAVVAKEVKSPGRRSGTAGKRAMGTPRRIPCGCRTGSGSRSHVNRAQDGSR